MRTIVSIFLACALCAGLAYADDKPGPSHRKSNDIRPLLEQIEQKYIARLDFQERREAMRLMDRVLASIDDSGSTAGPSNPGPPPPPPPPPAPVPVSEKEFAAVLKAVRDGRGVENQKFIAAKFAVRHFFTVDQLVALLKEFTFDDAKLDVVEAVYPKVVDKEKAYRLVDQFTFNDAKTKVKAILDASPAK